MSLELGILIYAIVGLLLFLRAAAPLAVGKEQKFDFDSIPKFWGACIVYIIFWPMLIIASEY